jgi:hypothetical protein
MVLAVVLLQTRVNRKTCVFNAKSYIVQMYHITDVKYVNGTPKFILEAGLMGNVKMN